MKGGTELRVRKGSVTYGLGAMWDWYKRRAGRNLGLNRHGAVSRGTTTNSTYSSR